MNPILHFFTILIIPLFYTSFLSGALQYWPIDPTPWKEGVALETQNTIFRGQFTPTACEGCKQLIKRLGNTANQIEATAQNLPDLSELLELEQVQLHCPIILYALDFGTTGTIISKPGYYVLCDDVEFAGTGNAITITTNHVTIDLNSHAIYATGAATNGIYVDSSTSALHNIIVKNGTLANFSNSGLDIYSSSAPGFSNLVLDNVMFEDNGQYNIFLNGTSGNPISNCTLSNCTSRSSIVGAYFNWCQDITVDKSTFTTSNVGLQTVGSANKCYFNCCHFNDNSSYGFRSLSNSQSCVWTNCIFNNNAIGIEFNATNTHVGFILKNCLANNNTDGIGFDINKGTGGTIKECTAMSNNTLDSECAGILLADCSDCLLEQCVGSANHNSSGSYGCYGIILKQSAGSAENNVITKCTADGNSNAGAGQAVGIKIGNNVTSSVINSCSTFSNGAANSIGISNDNTDTTRSTIIIGCVAGNNKTNFGGIQPANFALRDRLGSHWQTGQQENIALETDGTNEVGCVVYLDQDAFPLTITQPGHYILCSDINATGTALTINSDYVTFDMNGSSISGSLSTGIEIVDGHHDIVIKNGSFSEFSYECIYLGPGCYHIDLENLNISNTPCTYGIQCDGSNIHGIHNCSIKNCRLTELQTPNVLSLNYCYDIVIINSQFNSNSITSGYLATLNNAKKCQFMSCQFNDNTLSGKPTLNLLNLTNADSTLFDLCTFNNNLSDDQGLICIFFGSCNGCTISDSVFNNNNSFSSFTALSFQRNSTGNTVKSCIITSNTGTTVSGAIAIRSSNNIVENCHIQAIQGGTFPVFGIRSEPLPTSPAHNNVIRSSEVFDVNSSGGNAYGIYIPDPDSLNTLVKDCLAFRNGTYGIYNQGTNSIIIGCAAGKNGTANYSGANALSLHQTGTDVAQTVYKYDNVEFTLP